MRGEQFIENNVIRNRSQLGFADSLYIRRARMGRGFGIVDVALLPLRGRKRLVLIEAKEGQAPDAISKVIGQLLMYYTGALHLGARGVRKMRTFASSHNKQARSTKPKSLKMLSGGFSPPDRAWQELGKGRKLLPHQVGLYVALNAAPSRTLQSSARALYEEHGIDLRIVSVLARDDLTIWTPDRNDSTSPEGPLVRH